MRTNFAVCLGLIIIAACTHPGCQIFCLLFRGLVPRVDVITAPGLTQNLSLSQCPGRITRLITPKGVFAFDPPQAPVWASLHPGVTLGEMRQFTGFECRAPASGTGNPRFKRQAGRLLYGPVKEKLSRAYPQFAARL